MDRTREFLRGESGKELKGFLLNEYNKLKSIDNIKEYGDPKEQTIELRSQKKAVETLRKILESLMDIPENETEKEQYFNL